VETVRTVDPVSQHDVLDDVWRVGMVPAAGMPRHAWGLTSRPIAILTNSGTASASEVLTGALQVCSPATLRPAPTPHTLCVRSCMVCACAMHRMRGCRITNARW
jgi:Peptidase family S41